MAPTPFGLYIHWPFCVSKCPYCDFNSHVSNAIDHDQWRFSYLKELDRGHRETDGRTLTSLYFGGGTPSMMDPKTVQAIIEKADRLWGLSETCEITLEANPTTIEKDTFVNFKTAGVNRLSIGVQSLRPEILTFLGRAHDVKQAYSALEKAHKTFDRFNFDLIYAHPDQNLDQWQKELKEALSLSKGHLSVYQLTIEPGTDFYKNNVPAMNNDRAADFYDLTQDILSAHDMPAYEVSNHARAGQESRHNLLYWEGHDYLGLGPGAHSRLKLNDTFYACHQIYKPDLWLKSIAEKQTGEQKRKVVSLQDRAFEILMMSLRLTKGLDHQKFQSITQKSLYDFIDKKRAMDLIDEKLLEEDGKTLRATNQGLKCLNGILGHLL